MRPHHHQELSSWATRPFCCAPLLTRLRDAPTTCLPFSASTCARRDPSAIDEHRRPLMGLRSGQDGLHCLRLPAAPPVRFFPSPSLTASDFLRHHISLSLLCCVQQHQSSRDSRESVAKTTTTTTVMSLMRRAQFDDILCSFAMGLYRRYHTHTRAGRPRLGELSSGSSGGLVREC